MPQTQTEPGTADGDVVPPAPPAPPAGGSAGRGGPEQTRRMLIFGVLGFLALIFLLLVAFGGPSTEVTPTAPGLADLRNKGLQYAEDEVKGSGDWGDVIAYDATGQDRSLRDRREWQVCYQAPAPGKHVDDKGALKLAIDGRDHRAAGEIWLGAVRTDESCTKLGGDYGIVPRVYDRGDGVGTDQGTNLVPNLTGFTAHMARVAFGDDASIRVTKVPNEGEKPPTVKELIREKVTGQKAIRTDTDDEVGSGWDSWKVCKQSLVANTGWNGQVLALDVVRYDDDCTAPTKS